MSKQFVGWISVVLIVLAGIALNSVRTPGLGGALTGVLALVIFTAVGVLIRRLRQQQMSEE